MGNSLNSPEGTPTQPSRSFLSRWIGIYISPSETFREIVQSPGFIPPLVVSIISALAITEAMLVKIGMEGIIRNSIEQSGRPMTAEQIQQAVEQGGPVGMVMMHVGALLGPPIFLLIVAALGLGFVNGLFGGKMTFRESFAISCYANLVTVLGVLLALPMIFFGDAERFNPNNPGPSNLGFFLNPLETSRTVMAFTSSLDIFSFWLIALLGIGYSAATGGKTSAFSIGAIFFAIWLVIVLGKVVLAMVF